MNKIYVIDLEDGSKEEYDGSDDRSWKLDQNGRINIWQGDHWERGDRAETYSNNAVTTFDEFVTTDEVMADMIVAIVKKALSSSEKNFRLRLSNKLLKILLE